MNRLNKVMISAIAAATSFFGAAAIAEEKTGPTIVVETTEHAHWPDETFKGLWSLDEAEEMHWLRGNVDATDEDFSLELGFTDDKLSSLTVQDIQGGYRFTATGLETIDVIVEPPVLEGVAQATAYDLNGKELATVTLSGVKDPMFDATVEDVALIAYFYNTAFTLLTSECQPTYDECRTGIKQTCAPNGVKSIKYSCSADGSASCDGECNPPATGGE